MEDAEREILEAVRTFAAQARQERGPHPPPEDLLAYHEGWLTEPESESIRHHLVACPRCAGLVLDLARFPEIEPSAPAHQLSDADIQQRLQAFRTRLRESGELAPDPVEGAQGALDRPTRRREHSWPRAWTVSLLAATLGLAVWGVTLRQRLVELSQPAVRVAVSDLEPQAIIGDRAATAPESTEVPAWAERTLLILNLFEPRSYSSYQVEIFRQDAAGGPRVWSSRELRRSPNGSFVLEIPRSFLPAGSYRIELSGIDGGRRHRLAIYHLLLKLQPF